jgi:hypothetical protein
MNAYLLTGDDRYLDVWRKQRDVINAQQKVIDGSVMYPRMYGDDGWYGYSPEKYGYNNREIYFLSMSPDDRVHVPADGWQSYLEGDNPGYPEKSLRADLASIRERVAAMRSDSTTPDTRLADDPMKYNPASVRALRELMLGGIDSGKQSSLLHCRVRYFDPTVRRAGLPPDVAALVERMTGDEVTLVVVNIDQVEPRTVVVQAGAYAEHQFAELIIEGKTTRVAAPQVALALAPGAGARITASVERYVNQPTLRFPPALDH